MDWIWFILGAGIAIAILVVVHEFGHFVVAKLFRVDVPVFSVGMGPRVFGVKWKGTDYRLSAVPVGGYVRMSGADPFGEEDFERAELVPPDRDFMRKPVWQRLLIMLAGPAANLVLPVVLFAAIYLVGAPDEQSVVGRVSHGSPAAEAGLQVGDHIIAVDGEPVEADGQFNDALVDRIGEPVTVTVTRDGSTLDLTLPEGAYTLAATTRYDMASLGLSFRRTSTRFGISDPDSPAARAGLQSMDGILAVDGAEVETWQELSAALTPDESHVVRYVRGDRDTKEIVKGELTLEPDPTWEPRLADPIVNRFGMVPGEVFVGSLMEDHPAMAAGLEIGDRLYAINGTPVHDFDHLIRLVNGNSLVMEDGTPSARPVQVDVIRDGVLTSQIMRPVVDDQPSVYGTTWRVLIGVGSLPQSTLPGPTTTVRYGPVGAVQMGFVRTQGAVVDTFTALGSLLQNRADVRDSVGGPIAILSVTGRSLLAGFHVFAGTIAVISVSLAIVNLLPVPALDGGQIVVFLFEWIRGRPLSAEVRMRIQMVGVIILFTLLILVTANDIGRHIFPNI